MKCTKYAALVAFFLLVLCMALPLSARAQDSVTVSLPDTSGFAVSDTLLIPLVLEEQLPDEPDVFAYEGAISYDPAVISFTEEVVTEGTLSEDFAGVAVNVVKPGSLLFGGFSAEPLPQGPGTVLFMEVAIVSEGTSPLTFDKFFFNAGDPASTTEDGSITVGDGDNSLVTVTPEPGPDSTRTVVPEEEFLVPLTVTNLEGLDVQTYDFTLTFDSTLLAPVGVEIEGTLSESVILSVNTDIPGKILVAAIDTTETAAPATIDGEGTLIKVRLEAKQDTGSTELAFSEFVFNEGDPPATTETTTIEVAPPGEGPLYGDVSLDGEITAFDATLTLRYSVDLIDLSPEALVNGDVTGEEGVTPFDGYLILEFVAGEIDCFPVEVGCTLDAPTPATAVKSRGGVPIASLAWGKLRTPQAPTLDAAGLGGPDSKGQLIETPLLLKGVSAPVHAVKLKVELDQAKVSFAAFETALPDESGWLVVHHVDEQGVLRIAMAGRMPLETGQIATLKLHWTRKPNPATEQFAGRAFAMGGMATVNEGPVQHLGRTSLEPLPETFAVFGNFPNPFSRSTQIAVNLPEDAAVTLQVYDVLGRRVMMLERKMSAGTGRRFRIDGAKLSSGNYFYRVIAEFNGERQVETGQMVLVK